MTIDLEDWYHPEYVRKETLPHKSERIQYSLKMTLDLLNKRNIRATFFIVGELAEKHPEIIEKIKENNHEIAFHGYYHRPLGELDAQELHTEIERFKTLTGENCAGFRAPSYSLTNRTKWALKVLEDCGYQYDSSIFPAKTPLYGVWNAPTTPYKPSHENVAEKDEKTRLWEFPLLVYRLNGASVPVAGGFYLRFFPVRIIARAIKNLNQQGFPAVIFFHNWELDPETPRLKLGLYRYFVTYHKLKETSRKLDHLLSKFKFTGAKEYMESHLA